MLSKRYGVMALVMTFLFLTAATTGWAQFVVATVNPPDSSTGVGTTGTPIAITFSKPIVDGSWDVDLFPFPGPPGVDGDDDLFTLQADGQTIQTTVDLDTNQVYQILVLDAKSQDGDSLAVPFLSLFSTGSTIPTGVVGGTVTALGMPLSDTDNYVVLLDRDPSGIPLDSVFVAIQRATVVNPQDGSWLIDRVAGTYYPLAFQFSKQDDEQFVMAFFDFGGDQTPDQVQIIEGDTVSKIDFSISAPFGSVAGRLIPPPDVSDPFVDQTVAEVRVALLDVDPLTIDMDDSATVHAHAVRFAKGDVQTGNYTILFVPDGTFWVAGSIELYDGTEYNGATPDSIQITEGGALTGIDIQLNTPPFMVVAVDPPDSSTNVGPSNVTISITFNEPVMDGSWDVVLIPDPPGGELEDKAFILQPDGYTIQTTVDLAPDQVYQILVLDAESVDGKGLSWPFFSLFSTGGTIPTGSMSGTVTILPGSLPLSDTDNYVVLLNQAFTGLPDSAFFASIQRGTLVNPSDGSWVIDRIAGTYYPYVMQFAKDQPDNRPVITPYSAPPVTVPDGQEVTGIDFAVFAPTGSVSGRLIPPSEMPDLFADPSAIDQDRSFVLLLDSDPATIDMANPDTVEAHMVRGVRPDFQTGEYRLTLVFDGTYWVSAGIQLLSGLHLNGATPDPVVVVDGNPVAGIDIQLVLPEGGIEVRIKDQIALPDQLIALPVTISGLATNPGSDVLSYEGTITFDPAFIQESSIDFSGTVSDSASISQNPLGDQIRFAVASTNPLVEDGVLFYLIVRVSPNAPKDSTTTIHFDTFMLNEGDPPAVTVDGTLEVLPGLFGNVTGPVTGDDNVTALDAAWILQYVVELREFDHNQWVLADVSGNGRVGAFDASLVLQYVVGLIPQFPVETQTPATKTLVAEGTFNLQPVYQVTPTGILELPVSLVDLSGVTAAQWTVRFDPALLRFQGVSRSAQTESYELFYNLSEDGLVHIALAGTQPLEGEAILAQLEFALMGAAGSQTELQFEQIHLNDQTRADLTVHVGTSRMVPTRFALDQNFPNPFNPATVISYAIAGDKPVQTTLRIFNLLGQEVRTLVDARQAPGFYKIHWDGRDNLGRLLSSGVYFYRLQTEDFIATRKMILLK